MVPGILSGTLIYCLVKLIRHMAVLPVSILSLIIAFYLSLIVTGVSLEDAREFGWFCKADDPPVWYETWSYLRFDKVVWSALPKLAFTWISMVFVVALSSSLEVA